MDEIEILYERLEKAEQYFDDPNIPGEDKIQFIPAFREIIKQINKLLNERKAVL